MMDPRQEASDAALKQLVLLMQEHPTAKIVTDVGASLCSGWGEFISCVYHPDHDVIELLFD